MATLLTFQRRSILPPFRECRCRSRRTSPVVYRYADTMLEKGRDTYGPQKTGLLLSALERSTFAPLPNLPWRIRSTTRISAPALHAERADPEAGLSRRC
jgi:hypothetical protein